MNFTPQMARVFVASTWYETEGLSKKSKLVAKCRELVSGDRAEHLAATGDFAYHDKMMRNYTGAEK